ncbi:MAG: phosphoribosyltransferase family protein [bacterium]|nr:phosphoribosyltransferase family protein [bacterium]
MEPTDVMACLERVGAMLRNDHFVYTSGLHGDTYVEKKMLYTNAPVTALLCGQMARRALDFGRITCVVGPEKGGIILAQWVGYFLNEVSEYVVRSVYAEKSTSSLGSPSFVFSDGYGNLVRGQDVLLVDDVAHTGGSLRNLAYRVRQCEGNIVGAVSICNRGGISAHNIGIPGLVSLLTISLRSYAAEQCPLCANGTPVNPRYGRGREFLERGIIEAISQWRPTVGFEF